MPSLEILDISRNKIKRLPSQPGSLVNLRVCIPFLVLHNQPLPAARALCAVYPLPRILAHFGLGRSTKLVTVRRRSRHVNDRQGSLSIAVVSPGLSGVLRPGVTLPTRLPLNRNYHDCALYITGYPLAKSGLTPLLHFVRCFHYRETNYTDFLSTWHNFGSSAYSK